MKLPAHHHEGYDPKCPGCRIVMLDVKTGKQLPDDHVAVKAAQKLLEQASPAEQDAYIKVCVQNSRKHGDLLLYMSLMGRIQTALTLLGQS